MPDLLSVVAGRTDAIGAISHPMEARGWYAAAVGTLATRRQPPWRSPARQIRSAASGRPVAQVSPLRPLFVSSGPSQLGGAPTVALVELQDRVLRVTAGRWSVLSVLTAARRRPRTA